ncbi:MAG TPA: hypothetical protein VGP58_01355, partial [Pyrinomonadaceae bacterium]|nr:hypothetical protein [Pyrinomonadaceae bacterium]
LKSLLPAKLGNRHLDFLGFSNKSDASYHRYKSFSFVSPQIDFSISEETCQTNGSILRVQVKVLNFEISMPTA